MLIVSLVTLVVILILAVSDLFKGNIIMFTVESIVALFFIAVLIYLTNCAFDLRRRLDSDEVEEISCPKCGSRQITSAKRGFGVGKAALGGFILGIIGLLSGFIGSNKIKLVCLKCGHEWRPGK